MYSPCVMALASTWRLVIFFRPPPIRLFMAMWASGVLLSSFATGVGHNENALPKVRGTNRGRRYNVPLRVIPERGNVRENISQSFGRKSGDVLHDDDSGSKIANKAGELGPEPARVARALSLTGETDWLAREAASEDVNGRGAGADGADVSEVWHVGPVTGEDGTGKRVDFRHPAGTKPARSFKSEVNASDS